jgi:hypothetical protein
MAQDEKPPRNPVIESFARQGNGSTTDGGIDTDPEINIQVNFDGNDTATITLVNWTPPVAELGLMWNNDLLFEDDPGTYPKASPPRHKYTKKVAVSLRAFMVNRLFPYEGYILVKEVTGDGAITQMVTLKPV